MNARIKSLLKKWNVYHPLQSRYRALLSTATNYYYRATYRKYSGHGYTCNFCNAQYEKFVPEYPSPDIRPAIENNHVIAGYGENVYCPNCGSKNRERLVKAVLQSYHPADHKNILHFSPERRLNAFLRSIAEVTSVDITPEFYKNIDPNIKYADATRLPFPDNHFDQVIANHILEHIPDDRQAMRELYRVLDKDGVAILQVPYSETIPTTLEDPSIDDPARQASLFGQKDHVRIYSERDYTQRLADAGFQVRILDPETLSPFRIHAIQENESVFLGYKS